MSWQNDPIVPPSPGRPEAPWERDALVGPTTRQTLTTAVTMKAEAVAEAERLAKRYPAPPEVIMQDLEAYRLQEVIDLADTDLQKAPMLREVLRRDVRKAAQAQDDIPVLSRVAQAARDVANIGKAGVFGASRGVAGTARAGLELVAPVLDVLEPLDPNATSPGLIPRVAFPGGNPLRRLAEGFGMQAEAAGRTAEAAMPRYESTLGQGVASGLRSLTQNLMTLPMAFLPGGQGAALAGMTTFTGGDAYQQAREKGIPMSQALPFAASQAAVEYATEKLPLARLIGDVRAGTPFFQTLLRQIALEVPGEQVATLLQDLNEWAVLNPEKPFSSYLEERPSAAAQTLIATIVGTGGNVAVVKGIERMVERATRDGTNMQRAGLAAQALEQAMRGAEASRMRERNPEAFRDVMTQMAEDGSIYVDAEVLNQMPPEVLARMEGVVDALPDALAANAPVAVKLADVLTVAPGTPEAQVFMQNARTAPDAPSLAEAEAAGQKAQEFLQQEAARVIAQAQDQEALRQSQEAVKQNIRQQLAATGRFRDAVNEGYATWAAAFYTAYGSRLGMTPEQFYQRYPLRVLGAAPGQQTGVLNAGMTLRTVNVGDTVDGRVVRDGVPNLESIGSSLDNYEVLPGVREVPMSAFDPEYVGGISMDRLDERTRRLADEIRASGEITPLIVVQDAQGMYVLEGGHRLDALIASGAQSLPAVVVIDQDNPPGQVLNQEAPTETIQGDPVEPSDDVAAIVQGTIPDSVDTGATLESTLQLAKSKVWQKGRDLKVAMQEALQRLAQAAGVNVGAPSPQTTDYLVRVGLQDALFALEQNKNAIGWYDLKTRQALAVMALVHPEIATDQDAQLAFVWALAVTSNGLKVGKNFEIAEQVYSQWKASAKKVEDRRMPTNAGIGTAKNAINKSLALFNTLQQEWGLPSLRRFMQSNFTVGEITAIAKELKPGGEHADVTVRGASILGPKIGNGFFSNLYGNFAALTMDRWLIRTWGRWTGTLIKPMPVQTAKARDRLSAVLQQITADETERARLSTAIKTDITAGMPVDALAVAVQEASVDPAVREVLNQTDTGLELRKAGNSLAKYLDGQKEAPAGPGERKYIREVFGRILDELRQDERYTNLTMADLQAVLWYAEKRLYESAKQDLADDDTIEGYSDEEAPDYANAAAEVARKAGVSDRRVNIALNKEANRGRAATARPGAGGQGAQPAAGQQAAPGGFTARAKRLFIGARAVLRVRSNRDGAGQPSGSYGRASSGDRRKARVLGVSYIAEWKLNRSAKNVFSANNLAAPEFLELAPGDAANAQRFAAAITASKQASGAVGAAVYVYPEADYAGMRLFLAKDGKSGFALKPDGDIVSVFSQGGAGRAVMELAVSAGGTKLDAFDTILPEFYSAHGFVAVGRLTWDDGQAPEGWDKGAFAEFKNGEPDVVFMVYDPTFTGGYSIRDGKRFTGPDAYGNALKAQTAAMRRVARAQRQRAQAAQQATAATAATPPADTLQQGARGTFNPQTLELVLNPNADLSTWFHETGHFFLEVLADVASQPDAPAQIAEDYAKVLAWFGVTPEQWAGFTLDEKRPYHERWAESIEQYVMEGKAPSVELQGVMRRFRAWLTSVYQSIKQFLAQRGVPVAGGQDLAQPAFHGTPQRGITQFSTDFVGTGEGNQAYGWGLYFAGMREIAEYYRRTLGDWDFDYATPEAKQELRAATNLADGTWAGLRSALTSADGDAKKAAGILASQYQSGVKDENMRAAYRLMAQMLRDGRLQPKHTGQLYEVEIPEDSEMLLWDKPLSEQPEKVRGAITNVLKVMKNPDPAYSDEKWLVGFESANMDDVVGAFATKKEAEESILASKGSSLYQSLSATRGPRGASMFLAERGIKGIKYLDGGSRADGDGTYNYVVFSGDDVAIRNQFYQGGEQQPLNIQLNDDIRRVMDRMLATDEQIAQANEVAGLMPDEQADAEAAERLQKRSMADLKWAVKARDKVIAALRRQAREIEKGIREQVTAEVDLMPEMQAKAKLDELRKTSPEYTAALKAWQTQRQAAKDAAAQSIRDNLLATEGAGLKGLEKGQFLARKKREIENQAEAAALAWEADNAKPERPLAASDLEVAAIADAFGYESVEQMLQAIDAFGKRADAIDGLTEQRMLEEHGDLVDERAIQEAANEAVHNEARARSLATELRTQREMLGQRTDTGEVNARGARITVNTLVEAAKQFGANVIARTPLKDLRSTAWKHTAAERRAGKRWAEATAAGDTQAAVQAKQDQVLNNAAAKAALDAAAEAKKILEFFRRVTKGNDEKTVEKGRDPDIVNAARAVLAAYGIETPTTKGAAAYLEAVKTNDPDTYAAIEPMIAAATQNAQPLEALTFEELQGLAESIQAMWHLAKRSRQMEVDGDLMDIDDVAGELFARLEQIGIPDRVPGEGMAVTREEERGLFLKQGIAFLRRVEQWAEGMDGKYGGPFLRFVFQPIKDAADRYRAERITYRKKFQGLVDNLAPIVGDSVIDAPELGYKFGTPGSTAGTAMNEILHAIAHTGNESNKRKLLLGRGWATENPDGTLDTSRWDAFLRRLVNEGKLERAHYDFVQGVWDLLEETKPLAQKAHRDAFGRYFSEVTADAFVDPFGVTRRGGYVPAQVDSRLVKDNVLRKMAEEENNSMAYAFPQPAKGFTMARTEYNRPLMLDLRSLSQHLDKVLLFSHMTNPARDVRKLLTRKTVSQPLDRIQPAAIESMLQPWLQRSAQQIVETPIVGTGKWARLPGLIRARAGMALMFANVSNAIQQVTGLAGAAVRVKPSMLMRSVAQYVANPVQFSRAVWDASPYMDDRAKNEVAVMNEQMQAILLKPSTYEKVQDWSMRHAYFLQTALDNVLSPIVWTGAFNQALAEGMSDADAVRFADSTVRQTQGSTLPEDVSRFETGPAYARAFTQFVGYFNMMANTNGTALKQIANEVGLKKGAGKAFYVVLMGLMVPIWVAEAIALAFKGGPEDEDDDGYLDDWLASVFGMGTSKGLLAQIPILGQFAVAAIQRFNDNPLDDRVSLSPAISLLESSVGAPQSVYKAIAEDGSAQKAIRDVATLVSVATGVPVYGLARPVGYAAGVAQGKIEPTSAADAARGVVTGTASPESKQR